jgi:hypothetical protein
VRAVGWVSSGPVRRTGRPCPSGSSSFRVVDVASISIRRGLEWLPKTEKGLDRAIALCQSQGVPARAVARWIAGDQPRRRLIVQRWWREPSCPAARPRGPAVRGRPWRGRAAYGGAAPSLVLLFVLAFVATSVAACGGSGTSSRLAAEKRQILQAWRTAEQTVYRYDREPWPTIRQRLVAGTPIAEVFPALPRYFTGPALAAVETSVADIKLDRLNGAKVDRLGTPTVVSLHGSTAVVESCGYDSGTTTSTGQPGPAVLDGGAGYGRGKWLMDRTRGAWKIAGGTSRAVSKC